VIAKLPDQLLAQEVELDSREGAINTWEESLMAFTHVLGEARTGHDASCAHAGAARWDYLALVSTFSSLF
jgi:hypothetical protein